MAKSVKVDFSTRPAGELMEVAGLGMFPNKETTELTDEQVQYYEKGTAFGEREFPGDLLVVTDAPPPEPVEDKKTAKSEAKTEGSK